MFKKSLAAFGAALLATAGLLPASSALASVNAFVPELLVETRTLVVGAAFTPEANDTSVSIDIDLSIAAATLTGATTDVYRVRGSLKQGTTVISLEDNVDFSSSSFWSQASQSNSASPTTASSANPETVSFNLNSSLVQGQSYTIEVDVYKNGTALADGSDYTITSTLGDFRLWGSSVTPNGGETRFRFAGYVCVPASALSGVAVGDQLQMELTDSSSRTYTGSLIWDNFDYNGGARYQNPITVEAEDLISGIKVRIDASTTASGSGIYDLSPSIKKVGSSTELAANCLTAPSAAPTLTASAIGISMQVTAGAGDYAACFLAHKDNPKVAVASSGYRAYPGMPSSATPSCVFTGLKRAEYVGWYFIEGDFYESGQASILARSDNSPISDPVEYEGGNSTFPTFTGTDGGSGQGSLQITTVPNNFFDYNTAGFNYYDFYGSNQQSGRSSDGQGGLLIASIEGSADEVNIRRLTPSGQDMTFAGDGNAEVSILPTGRYQGAPNIAWYGTAKDNWIIQMRNEIFGYSYSFGYEAANETVELVYGSYASGVQGSALIGPSDLGTFCADAIVDDSNEWTGSYRSPGFIDRVLSAPSTTPALLVGCSVERRINSGYYVSDLFFIASLDAQGNLVLKHSLSAEPTDAEPCSLTDVSGINSGATGSEVIIASYQTSWLPSRSYCWTDDGSIDPTLVTSRDVYKILASTSTVYVTPERDVLTNSGTREPLPGYYDGISLIVSGPNVFLQATTAVPSSGGNMMMWEPPKRKYQFSDLDGGTFGELTTLPFMKVGTETEFSGYTTFSQITDFSENDSTSVLLLRSDEGGRDNGTTAARVSMSDGSVVSYRQMVGTFGSDGLSTAVGNASGDLNFFGIKSLTEAVVGTWVTSGPLDPGLADLPVNQAANSTGVSAPSSGGAPGPTPPLSQNDSPIGMANPFTGPVVNAKTDAIRPGQSAKFSGSNFDGITKVMVGEIVLEFEINEAGELVLDIPANLAAGKYDLTVTAGSETVTVVDAFSVAGAADGEVRPSTKRLEDGTAKVWVFDAAGAGKVQILLNGEEIAWVRTDSTQDPKLTNGYLVRTLELKEGKNVIEVLVDGERVRRTAYSN